MSDERNAAIGAEHALIAMRTAAPTDAHIAALHTARQQASKALGTQNTSEAALNNVRHQITIQFGVLAPNVGVLCDQTKVDAFLALVRYWIRLQPPE
jgi:hypothetical protein